MKCKSIKQLISLYGDAVLTREEKERVDVHVETCARCRALLAEHKKTWDVLGAWQQIEPPSDYVSRFWTVCTTQEKWYESLFRLAATITRSRKLAYSVALVLLLIAVVPVSVYRYIENVEARAFVISLSEDEWEMIENLDLLAELDVLDSM